MRDISDIAKLVSRHFKVKFRSNLVHIINLINSLNHTDFTRVKFNFINFEVFNLILCIIYIFTHIYFSSKLANTHFKIKTEEKFEVFYSDSDEFLSCSWDDGCRVVFRSLGLGQGQKPK